VIDQVDPNTLDTTHRRIYFTQTQVLERYQEAGTITSACKAVNISRDTFYRWLRQDLLGFAGRLTEAKETFRESLEEIMFDRLRDPKCHPVLIIFALKGHWREKYGDVPITGDDTAKDTMMEMRRWYKDNANGIKDDSTKITNIADKDVD